jgi:predicted acylesterase/phospholipase RssA
VTPATDQDVLVALAVSGGGSRAALFAAGAFEALGRLRVGPEQRSLLEQITYISSVSGGSLASAYYVLKKPTREVPVLTQDGAMSESYTQFFKDFKEAMARDYEGPLLRRQIFRLRWFNPAWTAFSLSEILDEHYVGNATFADLSRRQALGDSPHLLVNTTLYNDGRRFVLSTLDREALRYEFIEDLQRRSKPERLTAEDEASLKPRWEALQSQTAQDLKMNVCDVRVADAVAGSMSFPPVIGPITFGVEGDERYWHAGDGGLSDNSGSESLVMVLLRKIQDGKARRALVIAFDSSFPFSVGGEALNGRSEGFSLFSYDFSRIPSIMEERSLAYRALFFRISQREALLPDSRTLDVLVLRHTDAQWKEDLSDLPESCRKDRVNWKSPHDVAKHMAGIVTRLFLESTCDRDLILLSAAKVIAQSEPKIQAFLER